MDGAAPGMRGGCLRRCSVDEAKLIELIETMPERMNMWQIRRFRNDLRAAAGLPDLRAKPPCHCGTPHYSKGLCRKHYNEQRGETLRKCKCGRVARVKGCCNTCYMKTFWVKQAQVQCLERRHSWTILGICKICKAERRGWKKREVINAQA